MNQDASGPLPRTLEPESMDTPEEVSEYLQMDHLEVNQRFVADLIEGGGVGPRVLDLGCGTGQIPILLCAQDLELEVVGIDSAVEMLETARVEAELAGVAAQLSLVQGDCKQMGEWESGCADTVISNSLIHHLAEPETALASAIRVLRPGGRLFVRDLSRPETAEQVEHLVDTYAGQETEFAQQLLRQSLHAALTLEEIRSLAESLGIRSESVSLTSDRHWTIDWIQG